MVRTRGLAAALGIVVGLGVAGCGGGGDDTATAQRPSSSASASASKSASASESATPAASPSPSTYLPVPAGVTLSDQGSDLAVGQSATVAWQPRQDVTGVIDVSIDRLEKTSLKKSFVGWKIPAETESATPYFVRATITNRGESDLGGRSIPLYAVGAADTLIEATSFASVFKPCRDGQFPKSFPTGAATQACLVYFAPAPGELSAVSFRPTQEFDPITWTGELLAPEPTGKNGANPDR